MAVTSKSVQPADAPAPDAADSERETAPKAKTAAAEGMCVVDDGSAHMGRALPGKLICSAHEMRYLPDGTPRAARG